MMALTFPDLVCYQAVESPEVDIKVCLLQCCCRVVAWRSTSIFSFFHIFQNLKHILFFQSSKGPKIKPVFMMAGEDPRTILAQLQHSVIEALEEIQRAEPGSAKSFKPDPLSHRHEVCRYATFPGISRCWCSAPSAHALYAVHPAGMRLFCFKIAASESFKSQARQFRFLSKVRFCSGWKKMKKSAWLRRLRRWVLQLWKLMNGNAQRWLAFKHYSPTKACHCAWHI